MRRSGFLMITMMALFFASCGKDPLLTEGISFSVLGDSFSAFEGYVYPDSNDVWYCPPPYNNIDVTSVEDMWWHKVAEETGWTLDKNNSFSGSLICNFWGYNAGPYYSPHSFIRRMDNLGNPDVIFVFGGTNDVWNGAYSGDYVYSDWTENQLEQYRPALAYLFDGLQRLYPHAKLYFVLDTSLYDYDYTGQEFVESAHTIARHYGIKCIDLYDINKDWAHPNAKGQDAIARQVIMALREFNV
ncbi:MAG: hypothetical protein IKM99_07815 [Bacteroidales bacterium]|nr:hypothetical protein [Bacteroidales bacterium]